MAATTAGKYLYALRRCGHIFPLLRKTPRCQFIYLQKGIRPVHIQTIPPEKVSSQKDGISIQLSDEERYLSYQWLRNQDTLFHLIDPQVKPEEVKVENDSLVIRWPGGLTSTYEASWLLVNSYPGPRQSIQKFLWDTKRIEAEEIPWIPYKQFIEDDEGLKGMLTQILKYGFSIVDGIRAMDGSTPLDFTKRVVSRVCDPWQGLLYDNYWTFTADTTLEDLAYSKENLAAHNDTTYYSLPEGIQVLSCLRHDGTGGDNLLVDGFHAAETLRQEDPKAFSDLAKYRIEHEYKESLSGRTVSLKSLDTVVRTHPVTDEMEWVRYNNYDRAPIRTVPHEKLNDYYRALKALGKKIEDPKAELWVKLRPGMVLFIDNWRVLHGRSAFTGLREMSGCYLARDDWMSRARCLGLVP